uniref:LppC lipoprotein n=1 Tax=Candidatus Kentrum sp. MB TaxID=2138164 RepID=A0A450XMF0_9GAMM|nr:MAG: hypothetical protein BECKMB1821I_GA0114274_101545 [Candidatus Kentron sp. MB]VFK75212.1 MAG: hypothetical protein BECKMB1821H_GA0114242_101745 [Candidatus Kentron sp. MB]
MLRLHKFLSFIIVVALIAGCQMMPSPVDTRFIEDEQRARALLTEGRLQEAAKQYLLLASQTSSPLSHDYQLTAIEIYLDAQNHNTAKNLLTKLSPAGLTSPQQARAHLLAARIALVEQSPQKALSSLQKIHSRYCHEKRPDPLRIPAPCTSELPRSFWIEFFRTRALAHSALGGRQALEALRDRVALDKLLTETSEIEANHRATWQSLMSFSSNIISHLHTQLPTAKTPQAEILRGWLTLANAVKKLVLNKASPHYEEFSQVIASWKRQYPGHPAGQTLLKDLLAIIEEEPPSHIALLLPFDGVFARAANAVRDGFLSAWFQGAKHPKITIRNTMGTNVQLVYNEVISAGAKFVVGPLDKPSVGILMELPKFPVPTLVLNNTEETSAHGDNREKTGALTLSGTFTEKSVQSKTATEAPSESPLYQFTLSPESVARQTAQRARYDGYARAGILTPQTPWGQRMEQAFATTWRQLGGTVVESHSFPTELKEISATVRKLLKIDDSPSRSGVKTSQPKSKNKQHITNHNSIDCILMAAFPREARQLQPQIKFHHTGDTPIPVYATYHVFSGAANPVLDEDINGIIFGDMPWILRQDSNTATLRNAVTSIWPESAKKYARFYAFGIDAYRIIPYLKRLRTQNFPNFMGETGELSVDDQGRVGRQLIWTVIRKGKPAPDKNGNRYNQYQKDIKWGM